MQAMKCGCPVILADSSCLPEVGGDAVSILKVIMVHLWQVQST